MNRASSDRSVIEAVCLVGVVCCGGSGGWFQGDSGRNLRRATAGEDEEGNVRISTTTVPANFSAQETRIAS